MVLAWIGQILLFFVLWKLVHWGAGYLLQAIAGKSIVTELLVNVVVAVLFLLFITTIHSSWWLMGIIGALVGIITAMMGGRTQQSK